MPLKPQELIVLSLPQEPTRRRDAYQQINSAAHYLWGKGNYGLEMLYNPYRVLVWRKPDGHNSEAAAKAA